MAEYTEMLGGPQEEQPPAQPMTPGGGFSGMTQGLPPEVQAAARPPATPEEFEVRKKGWLQFVTEAMKDPNLSRAIGMFGVSLAQPVPQGQSKLGHFATGLNVGMGAFDMGKQAQVEQDTKQAESAAVIESRKAETELKKAQLPGVKAEAKVAEATSGDKITQLRAAAKKATSDAEKAVSDADVAKVEAELKRLDAEAIKAIPEALRKETKLAEFELAKTKLNEAKARVWKLSGEAAEQDISVQTLAGMTEAERKEFLTKSGRFSTATSGLVQQGNFWGTLYDKLVEKDPNSASVKGKSREAFQMEQLQAAKQIDAIQLLIKAKQMGLEESEIAELGLFEMARNAAAARRPGGAAPTPGQPAAGVVRRFGRDAQGNIVPANTPPR